MALIPCCGSSPRALSLPLLLCCLGGALIGTDGLRDSELMEVDTRTQEEIILGAKRFAAGTDDSTLKDVDAPPACPTAMSTGPNRYGNCICNPGLSCYEGTRPGCRHIGRKRIATLYFTPGCEQCMCASGPPECPKAYSTGMQGNIACKCNEGLVCFEGQEEGCSHSGNSSKSLLTFMLSCTNCVCKKKEEPVVCPKAYSTGMAGKSDCKCNEGLVCFEGQEEGCSHSGNSSKSLLTFIPSCTNCVCKKKEEPVVCPKAYSHSMGVGIGDCVCKIGLFCYEGKVEGCRRADGSTSKRYFKESCKECKCMPLEHKTGKAYRSGFIASAAVCLVAPLLLLDM